MKQAIEDVIKFHACRVGLARALEINKQFREHCRGHFRQQRVSQDRQYVPVKEHTIAGAGIFGKCGLLRRHVYAVGVLPHGFELRRLCLFLGFFASDVRAVSTSPRLQASSNAAACLASSRSAARLLNLSGQYQRVV